MTKKKASAFTIVSRNYFAYARTLGDSIASSNPELEFHILIVDRRDAAFEAQHADRRVTWVEDLDIEGFERIAFKYDILELNTNVKATFAKRLLSSYAKVIYLDPDIFVYANLGPVLELLRDHAVVLTPHITQPIDDDQLPGEPEFMSSGIYNLGFAAFNDSVEALKLLDWWERRCLHLAYNEQSQGLFVDQKWMDFAPSLCASTAILRDPQFNAAYWNLHERRVSWQGDVACIASRPLVFFHFSGLPPAGDDRISKYQTRHLLSERPDVAPLFEAYRRRLEANGHAQYLKLPYRFGVFSDGTPITGLARRVAAGVPAFGAIELPFDSSGTLFRALLASRLVGDDASSTVDGSAAAGEEKARLMRITAVVFRMLLRMFGPRRYERLMRYVGQVSNLRRQGFLLRREL